MATATKTNGARLMDDKGRVYVQPGMLVQSYSNDEPYTARVVSVAEAGVFAEVVETTSRQNDVTEGEHVGLPWDKFFIVPQGRDRAGW